MHLIDWLIILFPLILVLAIAWQTQRYVRGVSDFLAAGRAAGRFLVCNASDQAGLGAITVIATFEMIYQAGFSLSWWSSIGAPVSLLITLTGYVIYRYRETRAMTIAQFFELRYSKKFRIFMGLLAFLAGIINYGIFPAVSARFFVYYCGLPETLHLGGIAIPSFALVMAVALSMGLVFTNLGGQLTVMVADCVEGLLSGVLYLVIAMALLIMFSWSQISTSLMDVPAHMSLLNPFDSSGVEDFNIWYILIAVVGGLYSCMAWQGGHAFNASAANPHEAKMGRILGAWRGFAKGVMITLLAICAYTYMHHPDFSSGAGEVQAQLQQIGNPQIRTQMTVPMALSHFLPIGIKGIFAAIMFFAMVACDSSYLHSWGSIFAQDVILPFRKKPFAPKEHIRLLRLSILGVAIFAFCFSFFFRQTTYILLFFALTGTIYLGGAGACIIGGLYWKKGTAAGAWIAAILGGSLGVGGILLETLWPNTIAPLLMRWWPESEFLRRHAARFLINGQWMWLIAMVMATLSYVIVSLLTCRQPYNLEKLLHRGKYAIREDHKAADPLAHQSIWSKLVGIDSNFTLGDKILSLSVFGWTMLMFSIFLIVTAWNLLSPWSTSAWAGYWHVMGVILPLVIGSITCVWFTWGGIRDLRKLFRHLRSSSANVQDDGRVVERPAAGDTPAATREDMAQEMIHAR